MALVCEYPKERTVLVVHNHLELEAMTGEIICVERVSFEVVSLEEAYKKSEDAGAEQRAQKKSRPYV